MFFKFCKTRACSKYTQKYVYKYFRGKFDLLK